MHAQIYNSYISSITKGTTTTTLYKIKEGASSSTPTKANVGSYTTLNVKTHLQYILCFFTDMHS